MRWTFASGLGLVMLLLAGCGFQLRGQRLRLPVAWPGAIAARAARDLRAQPAACRRAAGRAESQITILVGQQWSDDHPRPQPSNRDHHHFERSQRPAHDGRRSAPAAGARWPPIGSTLSGSIF